MRQQVKLWYVSAGGRTIIMANEALARQVTEAMGGIIFKG